MVGQDRIEIGSYILCILGLHQLPPIGAKCSVTRWLRPKEGWVKLNSDGYSKGNPGLSGSGSMLRNEEGLVIWAQAEYYGTQTNMVAEPERCRMGSKDGKMELELGSLVLVHYAYIGKEE